MKTNQILEERGKTHGDFRDNALTSQMLKHVLRTAGCWDKRSDVEKEAIEMICLKLSRWVTTEKTHQDTPADIAGYAQLVVNELDSET